MNWKEELERVKKMAELKPGAVIMCDDPVKTRIVDPNERYRNSGLRERQIRATWEQFIDYNETIKKVADLMRAKPVDKWFVLSGKSGTGKTLLAALFAKDAIKAGRGVRYGTAREIANEINFCDDWEYKGVLTDRLKTVDVLIIDEVDRVSKTDAFRSLFFDVVSYRYDEYKQTIFISNLCEGELFGDNGQVFDSAFQRRFEEMGYMINFDFEFKGGI